MFDKQWFEKHQRVVIVLLNLPLAGLVFRRLLWIDEYVYPVVKITPTAVHVWTGKGKYRTTIYSNAQYAEAMHRSFGWLWSLFHAWDMLINPLQPQWNLGFDTYTSQPGEASGADTYLQNTTPTTNYGTEATLRFGKDSGSSVLTRSLIKFDLSSIPSDSTVTSATLFFWFEGDLSTNISTADAYRVLRGWVESQATWNIWSTGNNWTTAGCGSNGNDADLATSHGSCLFNPTDPAGTEKQFSLTISEVQKFINGTYTNYGWVIKTQTETDDLFRVYSSSRATVSQRPKLVIEYGPSIKNAFFAMF